MITPMTKYSFILLSGDQEGFLRKLQELGVVDITRSVKPVDEKSSALLSRAEECKKVLYKLEGDFAAGVDPEALAAVQVPDIKDPVTETYDTLSELDSLKAALDAATKEQIRRKPWGQFDPSQVDGLAALGYKTRFYSTDRKHFDPSWAEKYPLVVTTENSAAVWFITISDDPDYSLPVAESPAPPKDYTEKDAEIEAINARIIAAKAKMVKLQSYIPAIRQEYSEGVAALDFYLAGAASGKAAEDKLSLLTGFAPTENDAALQAEFDSLDVYYSAEPAVTEDNPPIKLKNNSYVRLFEVLTDMYGRPAYNGFDPTPYISIFFLFFFAFCMGDLGYGLIIVLMSFGLKKVKSFASFAPLVLYLGLATMLVGFFFHTFFSMDFSQWECVPDAVKGILVPGTVAGYDGTMVLSIVVGIIHISVAMIDKTIYATKNQGFLHSLGTWGWTVLIVGSVVVLGLTLAGAWDMAVTKWILIVLGIICAIGIFPLNKIGRNPLINIGPGLWDTYNTATGLLSDVLSYLRLYALGLAGVKLGEAFNTLGWQCVGDGGVGGWIAFLLVIIVGHTLNIAMCLLGAFVHPLRLNFLEYFKNAGYEAAGRNYNPLQKAKTN